MPAALSFHSWKKYSKKFILKKISRRQKKHEKLPSRQVVNQFNAFLYSTEQLEKRKAEKDHMRALIVFGELDTNDDKRYVDLEIDLGSQWFVA